MSEARLALVWCPCESREEARRLARALVDEQLVACVNILGPVLSVYRWQGQTEESEEFGLMCKTRHDAMHKTMARLRSLHKYNTPVIVGWLADAATPETLVWLDDVLGTATGE